MDVPGRTTVRNVQGLRAIAALMVVVAHLASPAGFEAHYLGSRWIGAANVPGGAGVDLFFVISGLIMMVTTWHSFGSPGSARRFLWRRVTRIYPLCWVATTTIVVIYLASPRSVGWDSAHPPDILSSYLLLPHAGRKVLLVAWTLVYEMYFYLLFALAIWLGRRWLGWVMAAWSAVTLTLHLIVGTTSNPYLFFFSNLLCLEFVFGVVVGYAVINRWFIWPKTTLAAGIAAALASLAYIGASGAQEDFPSVAFRVFGIGTAMALVVYGAVGLELRHNLIVPAFLQRWGDASYSLYLIHVPLLTVLGAVLVKLLSPNPVDHVVDLIMIPTVAITASRICYRLIERPMQQFFRRKRPGPTGRTDSVAEAELQLKPAEASHPAGRDR